MESQGLGSSRSLMSMSGWMVRSSICQCPTAEKPMPIEGSYLYEDAERTDSQPANRLHMYAGGAESGPHSRKSARGMTPNRPTRDGSLETNRYLKPPSYFRQILVRACHHTTPRFLPSGGHPPAAHKDSHRRAAQRH